MPVRTVEQIQEVINKGFMKNDFTQSAMIEFYTFLDYENLPEFFRKSLEGRKVSAEDWNKGKEEYTYESLTADIKEEISYLKKIMFAPGRALFFRVPRVVALFWVRGCDESFVSDVDSRLEKLIKDIAPTKASVKRLLDMLSRNI